MKHIVSFSGGKDSTAMLLMMLERGCPVDDVIYSEIWFDDNTRADLPEMEEYIAKVENHIGRKITRLRAEKTYVDIFYRLRRKGKHIGDITGWAMFHHRWCNSELKMAPIRKYFHSLQESYISYIGIAADEPKRLARLGNNVRAPLAEWGITECECRNYLAKRKLLNPLYEGRKRLGCFFCPCAGIRDFRLLREKYPEHWEKLLTLDGVSPFPFFPNKKTLGDLDARFSEEEKQGKLFEDNHDGRRNLVA